MSKMSNKKKSIQKEAMNELKNIEQELKDDDSMSLEVDEDNKVIHFSCQGNGMALLLGIIWIVFVLTYGISLIVSGISGVETSIIVSKIVSTVAFVGAVVVAVDGIYNFIKKFVKKIGNKKSENEG